MYKLSVIIPMYNAEKYIEKCIKSVMVQTYPDLEIICIDDGSTDKTKTICNRYCLKNPGIQLLMTEHKGVSHSRNIGLDRATGDYVTFVDADDWIEPYTYDTAMKLICKSNVDLLVYGYQKEEGNSKKIICKKKPKDIFSGTELLKYAFCRDEYRGITAYSWNKIFNKQLLDSNNERIRYDESLNRGEDILFLVKILKNIKKAKFMEEYFYHHVIRNDSLSHNPDIEILKDLLLAYQKAIHFLESEKAGGEHIIWLKRFYTYHASQLYEQALLQQDIYWKNIFYYEMKRYLEEYLATNKQYPERVRRIETLLNNKER